MIDRTQTVTPPNPSPPTNISSGGETPPTTAHAVVDVASTVPGDPAKFAPPTYGNAHEGVGTETTDPGGTGANSTLGRFVARPNSMHPSSNPDLEPMTIGFLSPATAPVGNFMLRVYGSGFYTSAVIYIDGAIQRTTVFISSQQLNVPIKATLAAGVHQITVRKAGKDTPALPLTIT